MILSVLFAWLKSGTLINPTTFFITWWGFFLFLASLNLVGIRTPKIETFNMLLISISLYSIGSITFLTNNAYYKSNDLFNKITTRNVLKQNKKILYFLQFQFIITIILLLFLYKGFNMLKTFDPGTYRYLVYTDAGVFQGHQLLLNYVLRPFIFISIFISLTGMYYGVIPKKYFVLSSFNVIIYSTVILGRSSIILSIISVFLGLLYLTTVKKILIRKRYVILSFIPILFILSLSIFRKSYVSAKSGTDIITDYFIWYLTGPFTAFDYFLNTYKSGIDYEFSIIRSFCGGIEDFLGPFIIRIFPDFTQINALYRDILGQYRDLGGPATHHNSHYTMLFSFYKDAGIYGITLFSFLLGAISSIIYNSFRLKTTIFNFSVLILITYLSMMGSTRWEFMYSWPWIVIFSVYILTNDFSFENKSITHKNV